MIKICSILFFCLLTASGFSQDDNDENDEHLTGRLSQPHHLAIIDENLIKVALPSTIEGEKVVKAEFIVYYSTLSTNKIARSKVEEIIETDSVPPFETVWDCSRLPDQDDLNIIFTCDFYTANQPDTRKRTLSTNCALDRNPEWLNKNWSAVPAPGPVKIDGKLDEWPDSDRERFFNNDNIIWGRALWDSLNLYLGIEVKDTSIYPPKEHPKYENIQSFMQDGLEFFFDTDHNHNVIRNKKDYQIIISYSQDAHKIIFSNTIPPDTVYHEANWNPEVILRPNDSGYCVEIAFKWAEFNLSPKPGLSMGFNLVNSDLEDSNGVVMTKSWSGITDLLHHNPSEWGNLILIESRSPAARISAILIAVIALLLGALILRKRKLKAAAAETEPVQYNPLITSVITYLNENYHDETLDIRKTAEKVNLSHNYLRKLFKNETNQSLVDFLNEIRLKNAKILLETTHKRITEVAFEVGYGSLEYFNRLFKDRVGTTPTEYRKQHFKA